MTIEDEIKHMSIMEILAFLGMVTEQCKNPFHRLKSKAMLSELQDRINYLWGKNPK